MGVSRFPTRPSSSASGYWLPAVFALLVAPLIGLAASQGLVAAIVFGSVLGGIALLMLPHAALWVLSVGALCVGGMFELYLPGLQHVRWLFVVMALVLGGWSVIRAVAGAKPAAAPTGSAVHVPGATIIPHAVLFFVVSAAASLIGGSGLLAGLGGMKGYFQMWGIALALAYGPFTVRQVSRFIWILLPIALLQWPVVLHQFFFLVPLRHAAEATTAGLVAIDVVSGTFGGALFGGGRSPVLVVLSMAGMAMAVMLYRTGRVRSWWLTALMVLACVGPLAFSEVKLVFVLLPLTAALVASDLIIKRPFAVVLGSLVMSGALVGLLVLYSGMIATRGYGSAVDRYLANSLSYNVGAGGYGNAGLNRLRVYGFWWEQQAVRGDAARALIGNGPGVTNTASITGAESLAVKRYAGFFPGLTGLSALLWEVGVLGAALFSGMIVALVATAGKLLRHPSLQPRRAELQVARVVIVLLGASLLHNNLLIIDQGTQTLFVLAAALILRARRFCVEEAAAAPAGWVRAPMAVKLGPAGARLWPHAHP